MKKILTSLFLLGFILSSSQLIAATPEAATKQIKVPAVKNQKYWKAMAEGMSQALIDDFWGANFEGYPDRYYFNYGSNLSNMTTNHYWPQAHAMDVMVDAYMRSGKKQYLDMYSLWWDGAPRYNFSGRDEDPWWNVFVDDMDRLKAKLDGKAKK